MSIFDLFSPSAGISAAQRAYKDVVGGLQGGFGGAEQYLTQGLQDVTKTLQNTGTDALRALMSGGTQAGQAIESGMQPFSQLFSEFNPAVQQYFGLLGVGTPSQVQEARSAWEASPFNQVLQTGIGTGTEDLARKGFGAGQTGATSMDVMDYIKNLTQESLGGFEKLLSPAIGGAETAAQGLLGGGEALGNLLSRTGAGAADLIAGTGKGIAGAQAGTASDLASLIEKLKTGIGQAGATKEQQIYGAQQGAGTNLLNALFGLGGLALAPFAGSSLGGSALSGIEGLFGGGGSTGTGAFDSMMQGSGFMDNAGNIY